MKPNRIILHHSLTKDSETVSWSAIRRYHVHNLKWSAIGYHFGIELVGNGFEVLLGRMWNVQGAHCRGQNRDSCGICFVGNFDNHPPEDSQLMVGKNLLHALMETFDIPKDRIYRHSDFSHKSCPGIMFPFEEFIESL